MALDEINPEADSQVKQPSHSIRIGGMMGIGQTWGEDCRHLDNKADSI